MSRVSTSDIADRIHSVAIHLLRRLRRQDDASNLPAPQLSALSVLVFGGASTLGELAAAEQVRPPTVTRLVAMLEERQLVARSRDPDDARITRISATSKGERLLQEGRLRRVATLAEAIRKLSPRERALVVDALPILERLARGT